MRRKRVAAIALSPDRSASRTDRSVSGDRPGAVWRLSDGCSPLARVEKVGDRDRPAPGRLLKPKVIRQKTDCTAIVHLTFIGFLHYRLGYCLVFLRTKSTSTCVKSSGLHKTGDQNSKQS